MKFYFHFHKCFIFYKIALQWMNQHICNIQGSVLFCVRSVVQYIIRKLIIDHQNLYLQKKHITILHSNTFKLFSTFHNYS